MERSSVGRSAGLAALAAAVATAGDLGQLWTANAGRPELVLPPPPSWLIVPATLAGAVAIPFYALGYAAAARRAAPRSPRLARFVAASGALFSALGGTVHAATGVLIHTRSGGIASGLDPLEGILESGPIVSTLWMLALAVFVVAAAGEAALPQRRSERAANPLFLTIVLAVAASLLPLPWRDLLAPTAVNVAHLLFFALLAARA